MDVATRPVVYTIPGTDAVEVRPGLPYRDVGDEMLVIDLYVPPGHPEGARMPVVLFVTGHADRGARRVLGRNAKDMGAYVSWARLAGASGLAAVTATLREPAEDVRAIVRYVRSHADELDLDVSRIGVWSCSGNVPNALGLLMDEPPGTFACAALCYGYMLDLDGATGVAAAAARWGFVTPAAGKSVAGLPTDLPLLVVRAGRDEMPGLNASLDAFAAAALAHNLPLTLVNHPSAPHAFDIMDDSDATRDVIRQILAFLTRHLVDRAPGP